MKAKVLILIVTGYFFTSCNKDAYTTIPQLTFKEVTPQVLSRFQIITFTLEYTDKEGDIQDSLYIEKSTVNCAASNSVQYYHMPNVPEQRNAKGDIIVTYVYGSAPNYNPIKEPACQQNDTCFFKFVLKDKAGNASDTAVSSQVVLLKS